MLGSTAFEGPQGPVELAARKRRSILAALALEPGATMTPDRLVDLVWGGDAPPGAHGTMHTYISGLRRSLEPDLAPRARPTVLVTTDAGYRLAVDRTDVDAAWFAAEVRRLHRALSPLTTQLTTGPDPAWPSRDEVVTHVEALEEALRAWRERRTPTCPTTPTCSPSAPLSTSCGRRPRRTAPSASSPSGSTPASSPPPSRPPRAPPCASGRGHSTRSRWLGRGGRQRRSTRSARCAASLPTSSASTPAGAAGPRVRGPAAAPVLSAWLRLVAPASRIRLCRMPVRRALWSVPSPRGEWRPRRAAVARLPGAGCRGDPRTRRGAHVLGDRGPGAGGGGARRRARWGRRRDAVVRRARGGAGHRQDEACRRPCCRAADRDVVAVVGRCSQDDGAPPLWPWLALLAGLAGDAADGDDATPGRAAVTEARASCDRPTGRAPTAPSGRSPCASRWRGRCAGARSRCRCGSLWRTCTGPTPSPCGP